MENLTISTIRTNDATTIEVYSVIVGIAIQDSNFSATGDVEISNLQGMVVYRNLLN